MNPAKQKVQIKMDTKQKYEMPEINELTMTVVALGHSLLEELPGLDKEEED